MKRLIPLVLILLSVLICSCGQDNNAQPSYNPPPQVSVPRQPAPASRELQKPVSQEQNYWMTTSSRKRHNQGCRFYKNSQGHPCAKDEGVACKICGG
jgi:hypothetical protein